MLLEQKWSPLQGEAEVPELECPIKDPFLIEGSPAQEARE